MFWRMAGWIIVVYLALQTVYSLFYHQRPYVRMATRARVNPETDELENHIHVPLAERLANRYLRRVQVMFLMKLAAIGFLVYLLLR